MSDLPLTVDPDDPDKPAQPASQEGMAWDRFDAPNPAVRDATARIAEGFARQAPPQQQHGQSHGGPGEQGFEQGGFFSAQDAGKFRPQSYGDLCALAKERLETQGIKWTIRVERTAPAHAQYRGNLGEHEEMTDQEFIQAFGGQKYKLLLIQETTDPITGRSFKRPTSYACEMNVPGPPKLVTFAQDPTPPAAPPNGYPPGYAPPYPVQSTRADEMRLSADLAERKMLLGQAMQGGGNSTEILRVTEHALNSQIEQAQRTVVTLEGQVRSLNEELRLLRKSSEESDRRLRADYRELEDRMGARVKDARDEAERSAGLRYESKIEAAQNELKFERSAAQRLVQEARDAADRRCREVEAARDTAVAAANADADRRVAAEKAEKDRELTAVRNSNEERLRAQEREHERAGKSEERVNGLFLDARKDEITKLTNEVERLRSENKNLMKEVNKPLLAQVADIQAIAPILGFVRADEAGGNDPGPAVEVPKSLAEQFVSNAPKFLEAIGPLAQPFLMRMAGGGAPPQPLPQHQAPQVRQLPPQQRQQPVVGNVIGERAPSAVASVVPDMRPPKPQPPPQQPTSTIQGPVIVDMPATVVPQQQPPQHASVSPPQPQGQIRITEQGQPPQQAAPPRPRRPERQRPAEPPPSPYAKMDVPAAFRPRGPQPAEPVAIDALLATVTEKARLAQGIGVTPENAFELMSKEPGLLDQLRGYVAWTDADNALILLEAKDAFWRDQVAREWFDSLWTLVGDA